MIASTITASCPPFWIRKTRHIGSTKSHETEREDNYVSHYR